VINYLHHDARNKKLVKHADELEFSKFVDKTSEGEHTSGRLNKL